MGNNIFEENVGIFDENIRKYKSRVIEINNYLSDNPEISGQEFRAVELIADALQKEGFNVEKNFDNLPTAFRAVYGKNNHKRKIAILTEYDALPEIGHACGHCVSCATSLLAGLALKDFQDILNADIHIVGTPCEETEGGKVIMVRDGVFNDYDMAIMLHMYDANITYPNTLALDSYTYKFYGKSSHASSAPWDGLNAFNGVQLLFHGIDMLRQHVKPDVRLHGIIRYPGEAPNIVPELCIAEIYCRAREREYLNDVIRKVDNCAKGAAIATGTTWEKFLTDNPYDNLKFNKTGNQVLEECYADVGLELNGDPDDLFGSTDAGNVSFVCPTFHGTIQLVDKGIAIHSKEFEEFTKGPVAEDTIEKGGKIIGRQIIKIFSDDELYAKMMADFKEK